jgi:hypothetical protein
MVDNNIDNIVKRKLEKLDFEFKDEYWKQMEQLMKADCVAETAASGIGIGTFAAGFLLVSFSAILIIISVFPWAYDFDNNTNINRANQSAVVSTTETSVAIQTAAQQSLQNKETIIFDQESINTKVAVSNNNTDKKKLESEENQNEAVKIRKVRKTTTTSKSKKVRVKAKAKNQKACIPKVAEPTTKNSNLNTNETDVKNSIQNNEANKSDVQTTVNDSNVQTEKGKTVKESVTLENDSVYIPDGKLVGDDQGEEMKDPKVEVQKDPDLPKNVKPRTKPVKHVFKKRRGLLYRLGIRK